MKNELSFAQEIRKAGTPKQTYSVLVKHTDRELSKLGVILLAMKYDDYVEKTGRILKADKFHQKLDKLNHRSNAVSKATAKQVYKLLNQYTNKAVQDL